MADKNDSGSKTEKPTPKRLKDAREKGDVPRSKDLTGLILLFYWLAFFSLFSAYLGEQIAALLDDSLQFYQNDLDFSLLSVAKHAFDAFIMLSAILLLPASAVATLTTFLQVGPVVTMEKIKPKMENLNPASGLKRMFSMDNLVEIVKSVAKTAILFCIAFLVFKYFAHDIFTLLSGSSENYAKALWSVGFNLCLWTALIFIIVSGLDSIYQKHSFIKKLRMSTRDIKQEHKDSEGDPLLKGERIRQHRELTENGARTATRGANVLLVNPTHFAVAIQYEKEITPLPMIVAKGHDDIALAMRNAASEAKVPILRNIQLTRQLYSEVAENQYIPKDLFDVIAEVLIWAKQVKEILEASQAKAQDSTLFTPGEDLTDYSTA